MKSGMLMMMGATPFGNSGVGVEFKDVPLEQDRPNGGISNIWFCGGCSYVTVHSRPGHSRCFILNIYVSEMAKLTQSLKLIRTISVAHARNLISVSCTCIPDEWPVQQDIL